MSIIVTGSIAMDHLMTFPGRITEQLVKDKLDTVSLSFLVDRLTVRRGGVGANIAYGLGQLNLFPALVGAAGPDFGDYGRWLLQHGVDVESVRISDSHHTARFSCTTDLDGNQIASFYPGAMREAGEIELAPVVRRVGGCELVIVSPNEPAAMARHSEECRARGYPFAADPSQQLALLAADEIVSLLDGAHYLLTNEYERSLLLGKCGWSERDVLERVEVWVTTLAADGARVDRRGMEPIFVPAVPVKEPVDPTGAGDAFRAGFFAGVAWGFPLERAAQAGCLMAALAIESVGGQGYEFHLETAVERVADTYGGAAATELQRVAEAQAEVALGKVPMMALVSP
ncbi:carbohydrate kinase family protein [Nonomuraea sp. 10N515B]|uniref:carbohydrate kinase family protein n=1 Tax=Nonomuraea sp. 10N515B TaxID=3457422 RepID=UPI003FCC9E35